MIFLPLMDWTHQCADSPHTLLWPSSLLPRQSRFPESANSEEQISASRSCRQSKKEKKKNRLAHTLSGTNSQQGPCKPKRPLPFRQPAEKKFPAGPQPVEAPDRIGNRGGLFRRNLPPTRFTAVIRPLENLGLDISQSTGTPPIEQVVGLERDHPPVRQGKMDLGIFERPQVRLAASMNWTMRTRRRFRRKVRHRHRREAAEGLRQAAAWASSAWLVEKSLNTASLMAGAFRPFVRRLWCCAAPRATPGPQCRVRGRTSPASLGRNPWPECPGCKGPARCRQGEEQDCSATFRRTSLTVRRWRAGTKILVAADIGHRLQGHAPARSGK